ncbi:MAG TPA: hypothetical protein VFV34_16885 [Blastocatellia bacterium]|nr:hypothetical protein [Blastocatellia bacterium]
MAAAKGMLPLTPDQMLEAIVVLMSDEGEDIRTAASATLDTMDPASFTALVADEATATDVLGFLCIWPRLPHELAEKVVFNRSTPDGALANLAQRSSNPSLIEAISLKQQSLIRCPEIIDAILANPARTPEAERRASEVRQEFFEKQFGVRMVADEQRARAEAEAAQATIAVTGLEDLVRLGLIEEGVDDSIVEAYEAEVGLSDAEPEQEFNVDQVISDVVAEDGDLPPERLPVFQQIALMKIKDRVMLGIKGTREARIILVRDPNRIVACAVLKNPRITDSEIESIASMRTVPEEVLRSVAHSRAWTKSYNVVHNLVRNPRTPISSSLGFLNRIQTRDLRILSTNKNVPDVIRTTASRLYIKRSTGAG